MEVFDYLNKIVKDDLTLSIETGSRLSMAAACFSIYAYQVLKDQLDGIKELRFIFTSPAFVKEKAPKKSANSTSLASTASAVFTERRAARIKELQGEAYYQHMSNDFKHINRLHGLSAIQLYQLVEVSKKRI